MACDLPHVLPPGSLEAALLRVRLGSASAVRCLPRPFTSPSSRGEAVVQLRGRTAADPHCNPSRDVVVLPCLPPSPLAHRVRRPPAFGSSEREGLVQLGVDERKSAGRTSPSICSLAAPSSLPHSTAVLHWAALGQRRSTPSFYALAAHLLQQFVDERASEHVEKIGSNPSMDA